MYTNFFKKKYQSVLKDRAIVHTKTKYINFELYVIFALLKILRKIFLRINFTRILFQKIHFFPADDLLDEFTILDWLKRNRYKRIELDWIMYSVMSVALAFLLYSAFLVFGLPPKDIPKKSDDD